jgi:hypothetical protein
MKRFRWTIIAFVVIAMMFATDRLLYWRCVPPAGVTDVVSFLNWQPATERFAMLAGGDGQHLMATGRRGGLLPSGPSGYVFDRSGRLVDWSRDIGDDSRFDDHWKAQESWGKGESLSQSEGLNWLKPVTRPSG